MRTAFASLIAAALFSLACQAEEEGSNTAQLRDYLASRGDPVADAKDALAQGQARLLGIAGYAVVWPGLHKECTPHEDQYTVVPGTGGKVESLEQGELIEKAFDYVGRYNKAVMAGMGKSWVACGSGSAKHGRKGKHHKKARK